VFESKIANIAELLILFASPRFLLSKSFKCTLPQTKAVVNSDWQV